MDQQRDFLTAAYSSLLWSSKKSTNKLDFSLLNSPILLTYVTSSPLLTEVEPQLHSVSCRMRSWLRVALIYIIIRDAVTARFTAPRMYLPLPSNFAHIAGTIGGLSTVTVAILFVPTAAATASTNPRQLFVANCSGCHAGGINVLEGSKNLEKKALEKYKYNTIEKIEEIIEKGKGRMPAYGSYVSQVGNIIPAKLTSSQIRDVANYVLDEAEQGWPVDMEINAGKNCDEYPGC